MIVFFSLLSFRNPEVIKFLSVQNKSSPKFTFPRIQVLEPLQQCHGRIAGKHACLDERVCTCCEWVCVYVSACPLVVVSELVSEVMLAKIKLSDHI